jgi:hypothetical protein
VPETKWLPFPIRFKEVATIQMTHRWINAILAVALLTFSGCGRGGPETIPVSGIVTFAGRERPKVSRVFFQPAGETKVFRPSVAETKEDGAYEVKAFQRSDGLVPGTYLVRVSYFDLKPGADPKYDESWIEKRYDAGELVIESGSDDVEFNVEVPLATSAPKASR